MPNCPKIGLFDFGGLSKVNLFQFAVPQMVFGDLYAEKWFELFILNASSDQSSTLPCDGDLSLAEQMDMLIVAGWHDINEPPTPEVQHALRQAYTRGAMVVGLCYGTYALAYSGLLDGKKAATHWFAESDFSLRFPSIQLDTNALYVDENRLITSAGTAASLDCCLYIVRKFHGSRVANKIARMMVVPPHREGGQAQFIDQPLPIVSKDQQINQLLAKIQQNPTACYRIDELAEQLAMSRRTFTRHFQKATGTSLTQWIIHLRLQNSLTLLENTSLSIEQISERAGFQNTVSFRQHFKTRYQITPNDWRRAFVGSDERE